MFGEDVSPPFLYQTLSLPCGSSCSLLHVNRGCNIPQTGASSSACQARDWTGTTSGRPQRRQQRPCPPASGRLSGIYGDHIAHFLPWWEASLTALLMRCSSYIYVLRHWMIGEQRLMGRPWCWPVIGWEIQVLFNLQQQLSEEADSCVFKLLPLLKHLLHVLHVLRGQLVEFLQWFLIAFFSLGGGEEWGDNSNITKKMNAWWYNTFFTLNLGWFQKVALPSAPPADTSPPFPGASFGLRGCCCSPVCCWPPCWLPASLLYRQSGKTSSLSPSVDWRRKESTGRSTILLRLLTAEELRRVNKSFKFDIWMRDLSRSYKNKIGDWDWRSH